MPEIPYSEVAYHDDYKRLKAIVGGGKLSQDSWPEWARLQAKYGWRILLKAADRAEPLNRWAATVEAICIQLKKDEDDVAKLMQFAPAPAPEPVPPADQVRIWKPYYDSHHLPYPTWLRRMM